MRRYTTPRPTRAPDTTPESRNTPRCALTVPSETPNTNANCVLVAGRASSRTTRARPTPSNTAKPSDAGGDPSNAGPRAGYTKANRSARSHVHHPPPAVYGTKIKPSSAMNRSAKA